MKSRLIYFLITCGFISGLTAQEKILDLQNASCQLYSGSLYCFGLTSRQGKTFLKLYRLTKTLSPADSLEQPLGNNAPGNYLRLYADTLHNRLSVYLNRKEKKAVDIFRFSPGLSLIGKQEDVETARLNNTALFSSESYYYTDLVYSLVTQNDTSGKQFFLNQYQLKNTTGNADYLLRWQYPFERRNVSMAHILYANSEYVLLYTTVNKGLKTGQWILKISARGTLVKGIRLNDKNENAFYAPGTISFDKAEKSFVLCGQKFSSPQWDAQNQKLNSAGANAANLYVIGIDSLNQVHQRHEVKIPLLEVKSGPKKINATFLVRPFTLYKNPDGFMLEADIFRSTAENSCYVYCNSQVIKLNLREDKLVAGNQNISANTQLESYFVNNDKADLNGKICTDSLTGLEKLFYKSPGLAVKAAWKYDESGNSYWALTRFLPKKSTINFSVLLPVKKIYELKSIEDVPRQYDPGLTDLKNGTFVICSENENGKLKLKIVNW